MLNWTVVQCRADVCVAANELSSPCLVGEKIIRALLSDLLVMLEC